MKKILFFPMLFMLFLFSCRHEPVLPEQQVSFQDDVLPIVQINCQARGCHGTDHPEEFKLLDYNDIMDKDLVVAGNPRDSKFYQVLVMTSGEEAMPRAPYGHLSDYQLKLIYIWIAQGAKNN